MCMTDDITYLLPYASLQDTFILYINSNVKKKSRLAWICHNTEDSLKKLDLPQFQPLIATGSELLTAFSKRSHTEKIIKVNSLGNKEHYS